jgi:predicted dehydrogenase
VASRSPARTEERARAVGAPRAYGDYAALLADRDVDAVYLGLPNGEHARWAIAAAEAGKHVLCDKSLALSIEDARRMRAAFAARGLRLVEAFMVRHHPQWELARRLVAEIGPVRGVRARLAGHLADRDDHRFSRELGGGALFDVTCYPVNAARFFAGAEPVRVQATARWRSPGVDEETHALLELPGGAVAEVSGSLAAPPEQGLVVVGERGRVVLERPFIPGWEPVEVIVERAGRREVHAVGGANHFLHLVEHVANLVRDPRAPMEPAEDGVANVATLDAIRRAAETGAAAAVATA